MTPPTTTNIHCGTAGSTVAAAVAMVTNSKVPHPTICTMLSTVGR
jgi:hypothetical protein